ncbi:MAG: aminopeptidase, partial [Gammaproteobacteria bacterium]
MAKLIYQYSRLLIIFIITLPLIGCSTISYYSQSIHGQFEVIQKSKPISELLKNESLPDGYQKKLNTVLELREFSVKELGLPNNDSYTSFADLERDYVIWNIFANPEFSLQPLSWCYFIVGCLSYRGYFSKEDAEQYEIQLKQQGYDTYLGGVAAYSTLGWFDDPVLNSMLRWNENYLATVMFHELAHQQVYIKNDTELNESYADAVAHIGVTRWLKKKTDNKYLLKYEQAQQQEKVFIDLINHY